MFLPILPTQFSRTLKYPLNNSKGQSFYQKIITRTHMERNDKKVESKGHNA